MDKSRLDLKKKYLESQLDTYVYWGIKRKKRKKPNILIIVFHFQIRAKLKSYEKYKNKL